jgi:hypothetical protein
MTDSHHGGTEVTENGNGRDGINGNSRLPLALLFPQSLAFLHVLRVRKAVAGAVRGGVVYDDDAELRLGRNGRGQALDGAANLAALVPGGDDGADAEAFDAAGAGGVTFVGADDADDAYNPAALELPRTALSHRGKDTVEGRRFNTEIPENGYRRTGIKNGGILFFAFLLPWSFVFLGVLRALRVRNFPSVEGAVGVRAGQEGIAQIAHFNTETTEVTENGDGRTWGNDNGILFLGLFAPRSFVFLLGLLFSF